MTLRLVSERLAERGDRIPVSTLARIEQGKLDPGVRRLHLLLDLYRVPPHLIADLVELELMSDQAPVEGDLDTLYKTGVECWKQGEFSKGLACFFAVRQHVPTDDDSKLLRQRASLGFAIAARNLGKFRLARQIVEELLCEPPEPSLLVNLLVLSSALWHGLGSVEVALAMVRQAATHLDEDDGGPETAWVRHQEARLVVETGELADAEQLLDGAIEHYRAQADPYGETRALILRAGVLERQGSSEAALASTREAVRLAELHGLEGVQLGAQLELGHLLAKTGAVDEGLQTLMTAQAQAVRLGRRNAEFLAHYYLWKTHRMLGDTDRARFEFQACSYFVRFIDEHSPEADEVRQLLDEEKNP
jgi:tetratricopeptide (TPR) repeat protein